MNSEDYNLNFDSRFKIIKNQLYNGIQARLIKFNNKNNIKEFPGMDIHLDLVCSIVENKFWMDYKIDFNNLQKLNTWE